MSIVTPLPSPPLRSDPPEIFVQKADAFMAALGQLAIDVDIAAAAMNLNSVTSTSATSLAIGTGSKTLTTAPNKSFLNGMTVRVASTITGTNWMDGSVTAYDVNTGILSISINAINGSGTEASWNVFQSAVSGVNGTNGVGTGGTADSGSVTLTSASAGAHSITPTAPGQYLTLPAATTMTKGNNNFSIYNAGDYDYGIKDASGTQLGWVRSRTGSLIGLVDSTTVAGVWTLYGVEKLGLTAHYNNITLANMGNNLQFVSLDANRTCYIFGRVDIYGIIYDASTQTWGAATLIRATIASGAFLSVLSASEQVLVVTSSSSTAVEAVTLTTSGTTITVNTGTKGTATLAGNWASFGQVIAVGTSWVISYGRSTTVSGIRAITISGTTPTIGAESALPPAVTASANLYVAGAVVRTVSASSTLLYAKPYTVSGSTLTAGTQASTACVNSVFRTIQNGNGNIVAQYPNTTIFAAIFKLTGTVEAVSALSISSTVSFSLAQTDIFPISASKALFVSIISNNYCNILTDTAGIASVGTEIIPDLSAPNSCAILSITSNIARLYAKGFNDILMLIDCSGASAVVSNISISGASASVTTDPSDKLGVRNGSVLLSPPMAYIIDDSVNNNLALSSNGIQNINPLSLLKNGSFRTRVSENKVLSYGAIGSSYTVGFSIQQIESAA